MERFRDCFYWPLLSFTASFERWLKLGGKDTRAAGNWRAKLEWSHRRPWMTPSAPT